MASKKSENVDLPHGVERRHENCIGHYACLIGKPSTGKHRRWHDDAVLCVHSDGTAILSVCDQKTPKCLRIQISDVRVGKELNTAGKCVLILEEINLQSAFATKTTRVYDLGEKHSVKLDAAKVTDAAQTKGIVLENCWKRLLRTHQLEGLQFLHKCITGDGGFDGCGAILADEMGLGKSVQCIALVASLMKNSPGSVEPLLKRVLLLAPCSLLDNWRNEFFKWTNHIRNLRINIQLVRSMDKINANLMLCRSLVVIIGYELFLRNVSTFEKYNFDLLICDEAHRLKNAMTKSSFQLRQFPVRRRIMLTGTPIQNHLGDLYSLCDMANPGLLGSVSEFRLCFEKPIMESIGYLEDDQDSRGYGIFKRKELGTLLSKFMLRRTQDVNIAYLPVKVDYAVFCRASALQATLYKSIVQYANEMLNDRGYGGSDWHLTVMDAMRKLCNHPAILNYSCRETLGKDVEQTAPEYHLQSTIMQQFARHHSSSAIRVEDCGKLLVLAHILRRIRLDYPSERVVIASGFTETLNMIESYCSSVGYKMCRLDGSTDPSGRQKLVDRFNRPSEDCFLFLLSTKAGGLGLNLIGANRLILYDLDWNPAFDKQAMARIWRDGQKKACHIFRLITTGTIEECIFQRQMKKDEIALVVDKVVDDWSDSVRKVSLEDLRSVLALNLDTDCATHDLLGCRCGQEPSLSKHPWKHMSEAQLDSSTALADSCLRSFNGAVSFLFYRI